ncbi:hypothetical protein [Maritalea sp.]|uniref:hypothetical protein n=1 Tax=Maritalea sp. TaxID=2003361 RepID=UPI003EF1031D
MSAIDSKEDAFVWWQNVVRAYEQLRKTKQVQQKIHLGEVVLKAFQPFPYSPRHSFFEAVSQIFSASYSPRQRMLLRGGLLESLREAVKNKNQFEVELLVRCASEQLIRATDVPEVFEYFNSIIRPDVQNIHRISAAQVSALAIWLVRSCSSDQLEGMVEDWKLASYWKDSNSWALLLACDRSTDQERKIRIILRSHGAHLHRYLQQLTPESKGQTISVLLEKIGLAPFCRVLGSLDPRYHDFLIGELLGSNSPLSLTAVSPEDARLVAEPHDAVFRFADEIAFPDSAEFDWQEFRLAISYANDAAAKHEKTEPEFDPATELAAMLQDSGKG